MKLYGYELEKGDRVFSESMGWGIVDSISNNFTMINHSGQPWRYDSKLIRSGCKHSDLAWYKKRNGLQIKGESSQSRAESVIGQFEEILQENYGDSN